MNRTITIRRRALSLAIAAAALPAMPARSAEQLEEILVTATRREQSVQDIPYNITAISGTTLQDRQIIDQAELLRVMSGVSVVDRGYRNSGAVNNIVIRGLNVDSSANGDFALNAAPTVNTYVNDTPVFANFVLKDVERVEVLRGPQGTLYGSGSLGGTVRYIMRAPDPAGFALDMNGGLSVTEDSDGYNWSTDGVLNLPLSDTAALRVGGGTVQNDGVIDYANVYVLDSEGLPIAPNGVLDRAFQTHSVDDADDVDIWNARASLLLQPNDCFRALLSYQHQEDDIGGRRAMTDGLDGFGNAYGDRENGSIQLEPSSREVDLGALEMDFDLGFATLTSSTSYYDHEGDSVSENTGFYAQNGWLAAYYYNYPRPMASAERSYSDEAFVQELRLVSNGDGALDYLVGAYYMDQDKQSTQDSFLRGFERWATAAGFGDLIADDESDFAYVGDEQYEELAVFGELTWHFGPSVHATVGARWFDNDFQIDGDMLVGIWEPGIFRFTDTTHFDDNESDALFKGNLSWDISDAMMAYGTVSEGYRRGGANVAPQSGFFVENSAWQLYGSDTVTNYELGLKGSTAILRYNVALFLMDWEDVQLNTATPAWGFFAVQNGEEAQTQGIEIDVQGELGDNFSYALNYTHLDAELTEDFLRPDTGAVIAPDGTKLPGSADNAFNASLQLDIPFEGSLNWRSTLDVHYQDETENSISSAQRFKATFGEFTILNLSTGIEAEEWSAVLWAHNLTDEDGVTGAYKNAYMGTDPAQNYYGNGSKLVISQPRTIGVSVGYRFR